MIFAGDIGGTNARFGSYLAGRRTGLVNWPRRLRQRHRAPGGGLGGSARGIGAGVLPGGRGAGAWRRCAVDQRGHRLFAPGRGASGWHGPGRAGQRHRGPWPRCGPEPWHRQCARRATRRPIRAAERRARHWRQGRRRRGDGARHGRCRRGPVPGVRGRPCPRRAGRRLRARTARPRRNPKSISTAAWWHGSTICPAAAWRALHRAVATVWGAKPERLAAEEITRRGLEVSDPVCHTTLETWTGMLATAAGSLAVTGADLRRHLLGRQHSVGRCRTAPAHRCSARRFEDSAWAADFLKGMPVYLVADEYAGLDGARLVAERARPND